MVCPLWLEQTEGGVPPGNEWMAAGEAARLAGFRFPKRRADWRLGRWTAKRAVAEFLGLPAGLADLSAIEIRAAPSGAPEVFLDGRPAPCVVSISHRDGVAACAVGPAGAVLGCDVELVEPRSEAFLEDYFTSDERAWIGGDDGRFWRATLMWSAKESALKALQVGLRADTRSVVVRDVDVDERTAWSWRGLWVSGPGGEGFPGWWRLSGGLVRTVIGHALESPVVGE